MTDPFKDLGAELEMRRKKFATDAGWSEGDHPRDAKGQFGAGGTSENRTSAEKDYMHVHPDKTTSTKVPGQIGTPSPSQYHPHPGGATSNNESVSPQENGYKGRKIGERVAPTDQYSGPVHHAPSITHKRYNQKEDVHEYRMSAPGGGHKFDYDKEAFPHLDTTKHWYRDDEIENH